MQRCRVLVTGASGTGTTSLGRAVADAWSVPHADVDDYFWNPTVPAYVTKRPVPERLALMEAVFAPRDAWILSGSVMGWGDGLVRRFEAVVFLALDPATRLARLEAREGSRLGAARAPGSATELQYRAFMDWASGYDDDLFDGRNRARHERWLSSLPCPVIRLNAAEPVTQLVAAVSGWEPTGASPS